MIVTSSLVIHSSDLLRLVETGERLGEGGFAVAFAGLLKGQPVCVKAYKERTHALKDMQREVRMLGLLGGLAGVPRLLRVCPAPLAIVTSFDGRHTLEEKLLEESVPLRDIDAVDVLSQVASTLRRLQARHLSHNDLKCDNIVLRQEGSRYVATVIDFGLACPIGIAPYAPSDKRRSPHLAPEIARGSFATFRSDVYSMGHVIERVLSRVSVTSSAVHLDLVALVAAARRPNPEDRIHMRTLVANLKYISHELSTSRLQRTVRFFFKLLAKVRSVIGNFFVTWSKIFTWRTILG
ncbi:putative LIM domain-containing serine/threonine-protein kinase DDB_G0287001 [Oratosquilla oratoria]|uniref:putative LIM domain-containing serine/threonine-protein kinase DDB_G0287001 n=1 Tax=Oratosquilla oratoria TaxID=337810 RepID=UPI003F76253B